MPRHKVTRSSWLIFAASCALTLLVAVQTHSVAYLFATFGLAQLTAKFTCYLIIRYEHLHAHLSHDAINSGPQKIHALPTPRIGGVAIISGLLVSIVGSIVFADETDGYGVSHELGLLLFSAIPAFIGGITEDITKRVSVVKRLLLTMGSAALGIAVLGASLNRVDVPGMDSLMQWFPFAIAFTIFAVTGATNAINIIDGYNGLAAGFSTIILLALALISAQLGDIFLTAANLCMAGALLGFIVWNWPAGKIFLGDGGAYLLGFWISETSVLLLVRHPEVSVWFPLLLMAYPVFETLFSIYRRKIKKNRNPGHPDALHLHQLIYKRYVRIHVGASDCTSRIARNSAVAPYIWLGAISSSLAALIFWNSPSVLAALCLTGCITYVWLYRTALSFKVPTLLIKKEPSNHER